MRVLQIGKFFACAGLVLATMWSFLQIPTPAATDHGRVRQAYSQLPLSFEPNVGQSDPSVQFLSRGLGYSLLFSSDETVVVLSKSHIEYATPGFLRMQLQGANTQSRTSVENELPGKSNYFIGNDPSNWRTNVPTYAKVRYGEIYPGIDLVYYGNGQQLEYDFVLAPEADSSAIRFAFEGTQKEAIDANGDLVLETESHGEQVRLKKPVAYQVVNGRRRDVAAEFMLSDAHCVSFTLGNYDVEQPLVIDPVLLYSTYLGGGGLGDDIGLAISVDSSGNAYLAGLTSSPTFPTANPLQPTNNGGDTEAFIAKLNATGTALVYSTYFGGSAGDQARGIALDSSGNIYVTGTTYSIDFPIANPYQSFLRGIRDAFVTKFNATGSALLYSTYVGGDSDDRSFGIVVDRDGNAIVTGYTDSTNFPTANPIQPISGGGRDAFVTKFNTAGSALLYSTYLGGSAEDQSLGIAIDSVGNVIVTGFSDSTNFPTVNPIQATSGGVRDAFVTKINASGSAVLYSTYLGGSAQDESHAVAVDLSGNAYVTGVTTSSNFPTANPLQTANAGASDAFVAKLNAVGSTLVYSTYLGGSKRDGTGGVDIASAIAVDASGNAYVTGSTTSANFPIAVPTQLGLHGRDGGPDAFITKLNSAGSALLYSTFFGGKMDEFIFAIAVNASEEIYVTGLTGSTDLPIVNALQPSKAGGGDSFVVRISSSSTGGPLPTLSSISPSLGAPGNVVNVTVTGETFVSGSTAVLISGSGIVISKIDVLSPTQLTAAFSIASTAENSIRDVTVTTPNGVSSRVAFTILR